MKFQFGMQASRLRDHPGTEVDANP
jgi:hypothetical protein